MKITLEQIQGAVRGIAAENPGHRYVPPAVNGDGDVQCVYLDPDTREGSCIIGHALLKLGVDADTLEQFDIGYLTALDLPVWGDERARVWADCVQSYQDTGTPWGEAVKAADESL